MAETSHKMTQTDHKNVAPGNHINMAWPSRNLTSLYS